ncbi:hypothetical protein EBS02_07960 [bacterium]|nr:hypothetical protein [bacterium]
MKLIYTSTKSQIKAKKKPGWQKAEADYNEWLKKHGIEPGKKRKREKVTTVNSPVVVSGIVRREVPHYPSLNTFSGSTAPAEKKVYTGDKIVGIAAMHKSNLVPIFNDDAAKDVASMRR